MQLATVGPASPGARAQFGLALLLLAALPPVLMCITTSTHGLTYDLGMLYPGMTPDEAGWIRPIARSPARGFASDSYVPRPDPSAPRHSLEVTPSAVILYDSRPVTRDRLCRRLELLEATPDWVDFRPDPDARYEQVLEILACVSRSAFDRLRLDHSRFAGAID